MHSYPCIIYTWFTRANIMTRKEILDIVKKQNVAYIRLQFTDMLGNVKAVEIPVSRLDDALDNKVMFDGSSIEGFVRIKEADMYLYPDINTFLILPFEDSSFGKVARFVCDVYTPDGKPFQGDPRFILKKQVKKLEKLGYGALNVGFEPEFYLFKLDENGKASFERSDKASYFDLTPFDGGENVRREIALLLEEMGFIVQASHHEVGPGQNEITFKYTNVVSACDLVQTYKQVVQVVARKHGYLATFMPKPLEGKAGNGMHTNCSIIDKDGNNVFYYPKDSLGLSLVCRKWMTGILKHSRELALLTNPCVNSYKRLVSGFEAPIYICWSDANRSSLIRIPAARGAATRTELRNVDPFANPYLALAGILACGLEGISASDNKTLPSTDDNIFDLTEEQIDERGIERLPETLYEAVQVFKQSKLLKETLGQHTYSKYLFAKEQEWRKYHTSVSEWEYKHYFGR